MDTIFRQLVIFLFKVLIIFLIFGTIKAIVNGIGNRKQAKANENYRKAHQNDQYTGSKSGYSNEDYTDNQNYNNQQQYQQWYQDFYNAYQQQNGYGQQRQYQQRTYQPNKLALAYNVLGVDANVDDETLKKTYKKLAIQYHPDRNKTEEAKEKMTQINSAYTLIKQSRGI